MVRQSRLSGPEDYRLYRQDHRKSEIQILISVKKIYEQNTEQK